MQDKNISRISKNLFLDSSYKDQPPETSTFSLNTVIETDEGDNRFRSNEESNEICTYLPPGFIPIGKVYINNNRVVIFSVSEDNSISEIGVFYADDCSYVTYVNDSETPEDKKLNFSVTSQIQATYRLRRGCEDTIYWVEENNRPRYFNLSKDYQFKDSQGNWDSSKFNLQKIYDSIPNFESIEVIESGGNLEPGSYNFSIQYLDESLNPSEWITTSPVINIYNDLSNKEYQDINGSINSEQDYLSFPATGKSIKLSFNNLDSSYTYYRVAIISSNNGSGRVNEVLYSEVVPIEKDFYIYTGTNHVEAGTEAEIAQFTDVIESASIIRQIENRLLLAKTKGKNIDLCSLQKYASRIKSDCITKEVVLNSVQDPANSKNPSYTFNGGLGYMPGETYSFGIVWIFEDKTVSPVFHIPGKNQEDNNLSFTVGNNVYPMKFAENKNSIYSGSESCSKSDYWGLDYSGIPLTGKPVRHHKFPLRSEIGVPLIENSFRDDREQIIKNYSLRLELTGNLKTPIICPEDEPSCEGAKFNTFEIRVDYVVGGENFYFTEIVDPRRYADGVSESEEIIINLNSRNHTTDDFSDVTISIADIYGNLQEWSDEGMTEKCGTLPYYTEEVCSKMFIDSFDSTIEDKVVKSNILGIKFSNITKPSKEDTGGTEVIGYYIVRNERTEFEKTILDTAVLFPTVKNQKYISHGLLQPTVDNVDSTIPKDVYSILHPEHKFNGKEYTNYDRIIQEGNYTLHDTKLGKINWDDVYDGSTYNEEIHHKDNDDGQPADGDPSSRGYDGWSLNIITRDNIVDFESKNSFDISEQQIRDRFYLDALAHKSIDNGQNVVYNIASDNKIGIVQFREEGEISSGNNIPYVSLYKENSDPYSNFRVLPYYKENTNPIYFDSPGSGETSIFNGDVHVSPMRYVNTIFYENRPADRRGKSSFWRKILGGLVAVIGVGLSVFTGGSSLLLLGTGIAIAGGGALLLNSGIKQDNFNKAYAEEYEKGLRKTALDDWVKSFYDFGNGGAPFGYVGQANSYGASGPTDDSILWIADCITDLWFETSINTNLRNKFYNDSSPTFLNSPWKIESGNDSVIRVTKIRNKYYVDSNAARYPVSELENYVSRKLLVFDDERDDSRLYLGIALGEYYHVNPDYNRRNTQKIFYHLPSEYDCCSECNEDFPHRIHYSEQSYQEELSDNFRTFLPNNYRDIEGETGKLTDLVRVGIDLYAITEEALWLIPRNYQERITDQIVSFIGTGEYFSIPPRPVINDETGNSAGCQHRWGIIQTPIGVVFPSENQNSIHLFDGSLKVISNYGVSSWFKNNMKFKSEEEYFKLKKQPFPYRDNPSNPFGTGFIGVYDDRKGRVIMTKKDFSRLDLPPNGDFEICNSRGRLSIFLNFSSIIEQEALQGWEYVSMENCQMKFKRDVLRTKQDLRVDSEGNQLYTPVQYIVSEFKLVEGELYDLEDPLNTSWTMSYSLKDESWISWHSYLPNFYISVPQDFYSWINTKEGIWKHNRKGHYQNFYGTRHPFIVEFVSLSNPVVTRLWEYITFITEAKKYLPEYNEFVEERYITFNKALFYNSRQSSGILNLVVKDEETPFSDYLSQQVKDLDGDSIVIDRNELDWSLNQLRDIRTDYTKPLFNSSIQAIQEDYFIDKIVNKEAIDYNKDWTQLESFRDKYLVIRLIFDNFDDIKLILNYSIENEVQSFR